MDISSELRSALGVALNEADVLGFELDPARKLGAITFRVWTLPDKGQIPVDRRVQFVLYPVGRLIASYRMGVWNDPKAEIVPLSVESLLPTVQSFEGQPIYGWEFIDLDESEREQWASRLSLDWYGDSGAMEHNLYLFQESNDRILDICIWFSAFTIYQPSGAPITIDDFCAGGKRWWDGLFAGDPRTKESGINPGKPPETLGPVESYRLSRRQEEGPKTQPPDV